MFFSIIIPVYNVECYLKQCLDSILSCEIGDSEILLVTGKSNDHSNEICQKYEMKYRCIKVLAQKGTGLSDARNCGMEVAQGEYVTFLDSDDYIHPEHFNRLLREIISGVHPDTQVYVSDFDRVTNSGHVEKAVRQIPKSEKPLSSSDAFLKFLRKGGCFWNVWRYVYRRNFLLENMLAFKTGFLSEDIDFTVRVFLNAEKIAFFSNPYYCYRVGREDSLMGTVSFKRVHDTIMIIEESVSAIQNSATFPYRARMTDSLLFEFILNMATVCEVPASSRKELKELFCSRMYLLRYGGDKKIRIVYGIISTFGISFVAANLFCLKRGKKALKYLRLRFVRTPKKSMKVPGTGKIIKKGKGK